jgi:ubiquitin carboxyl-terminal hydrolase 40
MQRKKINDKFTYPLELDLCDFMDGQMEDGNSSKYELKAIIIHRGGAYGGHYHAYVRVI